MFGCVYTADNAFSFPSLCLFLSSSPSLLLLLLPPPLLSSLLLSLLLSLSLLFSPPLPLSASFSPSFCVHSSSAILSSPPLPLSALCSLFCCFLVHFFQNLNFWFFDSFHCQNESQPSLYPIVMYNKTAKTY